MNWLKIENGIVIDPSNGVDQQVRDVWIADDQFAACPPDSVKPNRVIDARGKYVMPGGIDIHCHIAGPKVNSARRMFPNLIRDIESLGTSAPLMPTEQTGLKYAALGYTTAFDAAIPVQGARHAAMEFEDTPCIDTGMFILAGNNHSIMESICNSNQEFVQKQLEDVLRSTGGYALKLVNPGGVEKWKRDGTNEVRGIDTVINNDSLTPRKIIESIAFAANELNLPHPVHIHCNDLGRPGNWQTTSDTMETLNGQRAHLTHIQFQSYGNGDDDVNSFGSQVQPLADFVNAHKQLTVDVGQVVFGETISLTGDGALGEYLHRVNRSRWYNHDLEHEAGCGISPLVYKYRNAVSALQWMIGMEWFLSVDDPWQICLSTDHPNGGSFMSYPQVIAYLMSEARRKEALKLLPSKMLNRSRLSEMDRQYSLYEIAIISRAAPARILGLNNKGHLGIGADADVTIFEPDNDIEKMFQMPEYVIKGGTVVIDQFQMKSLPQTKIIKLYSEAEISSSRSSA